MKRLGPVADWAARVLAVAIMAAALNGPVESFLAVHWCIAFINRIRTYMLILNETPERTNR